MRLTTPRIAPIAESDFSQEVRDALGEIKLGGGRVLNIFRTLAHHPKLMKRWLVFGNHILGKNSLSPREREMAILRIGWLCRAEYEWGQHVEISRQVGLTDEEIQRVAAGPEEAGWEPNERALLRAVDELKGDAMITDSTWQLLSEHYEIKQLMDLVFTVGQYNLVSMALNTFGVQLDDGIEGFSQ